MCMCVIFDFKDFRKQAGKHHWVVADFIKHARIKISVLYNIFHSIGNQINTVKSVWVFWALIPKRNSGNMRKALSSPYKVFVIQIMQYFDSSILFVIFFENFMQACVQWIRLFHPDPLPDSSQIRSHSYLLWSAYLFFFFNSSLSAVCIANILMDLGPPVKSCSARGWGMWAYPLPCWIDLMQVFLHVAF